MKLATTTSDFCRYLSNDLDKVKELHRAGFKYIDIDMCFREDSVYMCDDWKREADKLINLAKELGVVFVQAHAPSHINPLDKDIDKVDMLVKLTNRSIELCSYLGIKNTVVHCGEDPQLDWMQWMAKSKEFYQRILPTAEKCAVNVLCENSAKCNILGCFTNTSKQMLEFIEYVGHPNVHACWDVGHGNAHGVNQYEEITTLGSELYAIHYHDNFGVWDEHHLPFIGIVSPDEIINALIDTKYQGYFTFEATGMFFRKRKVFTKYENRLSPQLIMQQKLEELLFEMGKYMLNTYGIYEE